MKPILLFLTLVFLGTACSQAYYFRPASEQPEQTEVIYNQGVPSLRSNLPNVEVATDLTSQGESMLNLGVFVRNDGDSLITFSPENVRVIGYNAAGEGKPFRVFSAEQFIRRRNRNNALIAGAVIVATVAVNNESASQTNLDSGNHSYYNGNNNWWWWAWSTPTIVLGPDAPPPYASSDGLLRTQTMYQGESVQGLIKVKSDPYFRNKIVVEVPVNGSYAKFVFGAKERRF